MFFHHFLKNFEVFAFFNVLSTNVGNQTTNAVDIISQSYTTDGLNENETKSFFVGCSHDITKPHCQHNVDSPVIGPNVPLAPVGLIYMSSNHPIVARVYLSHHNEQNGEEMGKAEVEDEGFDERPILFIVVVLNHIDL